MLTGERVLLRPWHDRDGDAFAAMNADARVMEFFVAPLPREESDAMLRRMRAAIDQRGWGNWCVDIDGQCAGFTGLTIPAYETPFTIIRASLTGTRCADTCCIDCVRPNDARGFLRTAATSETRRSFAA